jgi:hypothetical protein
MAFLSFSYSQTHHLTDTVARVAQWLEQRHKDLMIHALWVQIPLWVVGTDPSDETV